MFVGAADSSSEESVAEFVCEGEHQTDEGSDTDSLAATTLILGGGPMSPMDDDPDWQ